MDEFTLGSRVVVLGTTGSGKTVLARELASAILVPHIELDALRWDPDWTEVPSGVFRERVAEALFGERWIVDGNYGIARDLVWPKAADLAWLDYHLTVIMRRLFWRTVRRVFTRRSFGTGTTNAFATPSSAKTRCSSGR